MFYYKLLSPEIHALHLEVPAKEFLNVWKNTITGGNKDIDQLVQMLNPYIDYWLKLLNKEIQPDVQLITLYQYLEAAEAIDNLSFWLDTSRDIRSDLLYVLINTISHFKYFPNEASAIKAEYVFALRYIRNLKRFLLKQVPLAIEIENSSAEFNEYPDYYLLDTINKNPWTSYLFFLIANGYCATEIANITKIPRETFYYEELRIWEQLKKLWQQAE